MSKKTHTKISDNELVQLYLKTQNSSYFSKLYGKYADKVYFKCISILKDEMAAQDAMQDIFTKIYLNLASFSEKSQFSTWIYSITYNYCIDLTRKAKKDKALFVDDIERAPDVEDEVGDYFLLEMEVDRLKQVLDELSVDDRAILLMKYQDDLQIKEIADMLDKTESAIKMKIMRAKEKAKKIYSELFSDN